MRLLAFLLSLGLLLAGPSALAQQLRVQGVELLWYGTYEAGKTDEIKDKSAATGTRYSSTNIVAPRENSDRIALKNGVRFGFGYKVVGTPNGAGIRITHLRHFPPPGVKNSATGNRMMTEERAFDITLGEERFMGFVLGEELPTGPWTFQVLYGTRLLLEKTFTVYKP